MKIELELLVSFIFAIIIVYKMSKNQILELLNNRKFMILKNKALLKRELKRAKLENKEDQIQLRSYQNQHENWKKEAEKLYLEELKIHKQAFEKELMMIEKKVNLIEQRKKNEQYILQEQEIISALIHNLRLNSEKISLVNLMNKHF